jgi:hypothetical protein
MKHSQDYVTLCLQQDFSCNGVLFVQNIENFFLEILAAGLE